MTQMEKLISKLAQFDIPFEVRLDFFNRPQVCYPTQGAGMVYDVACNEMTYGNHAGLLEMMTHVPNGFPDYDDEVKGCLTANEAFGLIADHYFGW